MAPDHAGVGLLQLLVGGPGVLGLRDLEAALAPVNVSLGVDDLPAEQHWEPSPDQDGRAHHDHQDQEGADHPGHGVDLKLGI